MPSVACSGIMRWNDRRQLSTLDAAGTDAVVSAWTPSPESGPGGPELRSSRNGACTHARPQPLQAWRRAALPREKFSG
eukprot:364152-Chlamydomonas_euryale.AAC.7